MFDIDLQSRIPIYEQLYRRVVELVMKKQLKPGDKLPSVRELAKQLGVNPNTVSKAFGLLERDGVICTTPGRGSFVSEKNKNIVIQKAKTDFSAAVRTALAAGLTISDLNMIIGRAATSAENITHEEEQND